MQSLHELPKQENFGGDINNSKRAAASSSAKFDRLILPDQTDANNYKDAGPFSSFSRESVVAVVSVAAVLLAIVGSLVFLVLRRGGKRKKLYEEVPEDGNRSRKTSMRPNDPTLYVQNRVIDFVVPNIQTAVAPVSSPPDSLSLSSGSSTDIPLWAKLALLDNTSQSSLVLPGLSVLGGINPELYRVGLDETEEDSSYPDGHKGRLWMSLHYDPASERLSVKISKAKNLPSRTCGSVNNCDPFVRLSLIPDERRYLQSKTKKKNCNPKFDETFVFQIPVKAMEERTLKLSVYDNDRGKRHNIIGHALFPLKDLDLTSNENIDVWKDLEAEVQDTPSDLGEMLVSLCYNQNLERLTVTVFEAKHLRFPDNTPPLDTYVKVTFMLENKAVKSKKTAVTKRRSDPKYNESFNFRVTPDGVTSASAILQVMVVKTNGKDKVLGRLVLGSYMFARGKARDHWNEVMSAGHRQIRHWHKLS